METPMNQPDEIHVVTGLLKQGAGGTPVHFAWAAPEPAQHCADRLRKDSSYEKVAGPDKYVKAATE